MFTVGTLKQRVVAQTQYATDQGSLVPACFEREMVIRQHAIPFIVRIAANLQDKDRDRQEQRAQKMQSGREPNPFLPYHPDMFVADISTTHVCLLNRFKLFDYPLLIVTRDYAAQENPLTLEDFDAISRCLLEMEGIAFYNGDLQSGASQPHKHFHFIPYPVTTSCHAVPVAERFAPLGRYDELIELDFLPYKHLLCALEWRQDWRPEAIARQLEKLYRRLLQELKQRYPETPDKHFTQAYNLIVTRDWMKLVLRSAPQFASIPLNALSFTGIFNVRGDCQVDEVVRFSPFTVLQGLGVPR